MERERGIERVSERHSERQRKRQREREMEIDREKAPQCQMPHVRVPQQRSTQMIGSIKSVPVPCLGVVIDLI